MVSHDRQPSLGGAGLAGDPERPGARKYRSGRSGERPLIVSAPGVEVSPRYLPKGQVLELLVGDDPLELLVLLTERLEFLNVIGFHTAILMSPTVKTLLKDLEALGNLRDSLSFRQETVSLAQLPDDLLGSVTSILHEDPFMPNLRALSDSHKK